MRNNKATEGFEKLRFRPRNAVLGTSTCSRRPLLSRHCIVTYRQTDRQGGMMEGRKEETKEEIPENLRRRRLCPLHRLREQKERKGRARIRQTMGRREPVGKSQGTKVRNSKKGGGPQKQLPSLPAYVFERCCALLLSFLGELTQTH